MTLSQLTVREALGIDGLQNVRVLAGSAGLDRNITCVNVMEVPDILQWVRGGELLLTTTYPLKDSRVSLRDLIPRLNEKGMAAIAIKPHRYLEEVPIEIISIADELAFPVLELPLDASFVDVINAVLSRILNFQAGLLLRSEEIHRRFTGVVLDGGGLAEIAALLSGLLHKPVSILGTEGEMLASAGNIPEVERVQGEGERLLRRLGTAPLLQSSQQGMLHRKSLDTAEGETPIVQRTIKTGRLHYGEIIVWETGAPIPETDLVAIEHAATVAALAILKARAVSEVELRFSNEFLNDLLSGSIHDQAQLLTRAEALGWDLRGPFVVMVADIDGLEHAYQADPGSDTDSALETARRIGRQFTNTARRIDPGVITWNRTGSLTALCAIAGSGGRMPTPQEARKRATLVASQLQHQLALEYSLVLHWGIGGFYADVLDLHKAYNEARLAATIGRLVSEPGTLNHYEDMGVYRLLHQFPDPERLREFAGDVLRPVLDYDARHEGKLLAAIEKYLACERNLALTSRELGLHYNTVKYRVQKADDLLSGALRNPHRRLELELAIKALKLR